jgi:hypothetical protein
MNVDIEASLPLETSALTRSPTSNRAPNTSVPSALPILAQVRELPGPHRQKLIVDPQPDHVDHQEGTWIATLR